MSYCKFKKSETSKTGYELIAGEFLSDKVYLVEPYFVRRTSPKFSLVSKGKHISGLFPSCMDSALLGDYNGSGLIIFQIADEIELFMVPYLRGDLMQRFCSGSLNDLLADLRERFSYSKVKR